MQQMVSHKLDRMTNRKSTWEQKLTFPRVMKQKASDGPSGVAKNVNWGAPLPCPVPLLPSPSPPLPLLTGVRRYNPRKFFKIKGARR